jgi:FMN phosphatase YigB (HAD superfamily)
LSNRSKPRIRAILSDWGKVVVDFDNTRVAKALVQHSSFGTASELHELMFKEQRELFDAYMRGHLTTAGFRKAMKRVAQLTCTDVVFDWAFADVFTPNQPIIDLWKRLRAQGVKMVAASNVEKLRHDRLIEMGVHDLFDKHCLSYQIKRGKPEPEFWHEAMRLAYISPEEALFVDDHEEFVEVARSQLINGFTYDLNDHAAFERYLEGFEIAPYRLA